ncbi:MAG: tRNA 2-thiouridine(34) synthase MnmA [Oscillospiraceae bacterium]|nr:tRNA 2-thiouridine(34) synthase MnmA [Oscillospiraceae bacterium]
MAGKALIAMSGGVDSSVAAYLMKSQGYSCIGATMKLVENDNSIESSRTCCSLEDTQAARSVADRLDISFYVFNFKEEFEQCVIDKFVRVYQEGATPSPCIDCNRYLKFEKFLHRSRELECDFMVTGHYGRIERVGQRYLLKKGKDAAKDQSYFLYTMTQEQLAQIRFPLGEYNKEQIRKIAAAQGFVNADKRDSQDICFVPGGDYTAFIESYSGVTFPQGDFTDSGGKILGKHRGIIRYTVGQRKGLNLGLPYPVYVQRKDLATNTVVVTRDVSGLLSRELFAEDFNWIAYDNPPVGFSVRVGAKIRSTAREAAAAASVCEDGRVRVVFDEPQKAIAAGQAVVLYDDDVVIGGGTIC